MRKPLLDPPCADEAPVGDKLTPYDEEHLITYIRLMVAAHDDTADWREVAKLVLHIDPADVPDRARRSLRSHMARVRWLANGGWRLLLEDDSEAPTLKWSSNPPP